MKGSNSIAGSSSQIGTSQPSLMPASPRSLESLTSCPSDPPVTIQVSLEERLLDSGRLKKVEKCLKEAKNDVTLLSTDEQTIGFTSFVLKNMSRFFKGLFRSKCKENVTRQVKTMLTLSTLKTVVKFFKSGEVELSMDNVHQVLLGAHYLQCDSLLKLCSRFLVEHVPETAHLCFDLAAYYRDMTHLGEQAAIACAERLKDCKKILPSFSERWFTFVLHQNDLNVATEDEVVALVIEWNKYEERTAEEIWRVLETIRYPHLTPHAFSELLEHFELAEELTYVRLCQKNRFNEMPAEQLRRRRFYSDHLHLMWNESTETAVRHRFTCLQCLNGKVLSHDALHEIPDLHNGLYSLQILTVMNSLQLLHYAGDSPDILTYRRRNGRWILKTKRWSRSTLDSSDLRPMSACAYQGKTILKSRRLTEDGELVEIDNSTRAYTFTPIDISHFNSLVGDADSCLRCMHFGDEYATFLNRHDVRFYHRVTGECTVVSLPVPFPETHNVDIDSIVGPDKYLYVSVRQYSSNAFDWDSDVGYSHSGYLHRLNFNTQSLESTAQLPKYESTSYWCCGSVEGFRLTKSGSKVLLVRPDSTINAHRVYEVLADGTEVSPLVNLPFDTFQLPPSIDFLHFEEAVPTYIHACVHATLLQEFCGSLADPDDHKLLEKLAFYL